MKSKLLKKAVCWVTAMLMISVTVLPSLGAVSAETIEYAMFPGSVLKVTQGAYGEYNSYSHNGQGGYYQNAFDLAGNDNYFAPFSGTITQIKTSYNAVILQSDNKVYWADGSYDYMSVCFVHDNDISDLYVGKHVNQGEIFYQPGVKDPGGYTTGTHLHICVNRGQTTAGISIFSGDARPNEAFFLSQSTSIVQTGGYTWQTQAHTHSYNTYSHNSSAHPHNKCYTCSCGEVWENTSEPTFSSSCAECLSTVRPGIPGFTDLSGSYTDDDVITFNWSETENTTHYNLYIDTLIDDSFAEYEYIQNAEQGITRQLPEGLYKVRLTAYNSAYYETDGSDYLHTDSEEYNIVVTDSDKDPNEFGSWMTVLPEGVTEEDYIIESKTMYRYRDNTQYTEYGSWGAETVSATAPVESDTTKINSVTTYYNYYHYCCNYYDSMYNVDSIPYGSGSHYYHTLTLTYELSPSSVGDMGGATMYGSYTCEKGFKVWAQCTPFVTYEYRYVTRSATTVTNYGEWSSWQNEMPEAITNRDIEEAVFYRYKLRCAHENTCVLNRVEPTCTAAGYSGDTVCSDCGATVSSGSELELLEHNYISNVIEPTTEAQGYTVHICSGCNDAYVDSFVSALVPGDINGDGIITAEDLAALRKALLFDSFDKLCDLNGNGKLDVCDLIRLKKSLTA